MKSYINQGINDAIAAGFIPPRPKEFDEDVFSATTATVLIELQENLFAWSGKRDGAAALNDIYKAIRASGDAFGATMYLALIGWAGVTEDTLELMKQFYLNRKSVHALKVREWVFACNVRLKTEVGNILRFKIGDAILQGEVKAVFPGMAYAMVEVEKGKGVIRVLAEDILKVFPTKPTKPLTPPPAGTPVAVAA